jgi:hypothetical protein
MPIPTPDFTFHVSTPSADHVRGLMAEVGAILTGRRTFEVAGGWGGRHPWDSPGFVLTHHVLDGWRPRGSDGRHRVSVSPICAIPCTRHRPPPDVLKV